MFGEAECVEEVGGVVFGDEGGGLVVVDFLEEADEATDDVGVGVGDELDVFLLSVLLCIGVECFSDEPDP